MIAALFIVGDVVYQEYGSNLLAARRAETIRETLRSEWEKTPSAPGQKVGRPVPPTITRRSEGFGLLYIPRLRSTAWEIPVLSGTSGKELNAGVGHHEDSALPWQDGNVVLSGHRTSHGRPFAEIEKLRVGDEVLLETRDAWYVYTLVDDAVVKPDALWVMKTTPTAALAGERKVLTLITCTPKGSTSKRWVWWGKLTEVRAKDTAPVVILKTTSPRPSAPVVTTPLTLPVTEPDSTDESAPEPTVEESRSTTLSTPPTPVLEGRRVSGFGYESSKMNRRVTRELDALVEKTARDFSGRIE